MKVQPFVPKNGPQLTLTVAPAILLPLTTLAVCMRLYSRHLTKQKLKADDWLVALGLVLAYALYADVVVCVVWGGLGVSITQLSPGNFEIFAKSGAIASGILWGSAVAITQLSILSFYIRIFGIAHPWMKYASWAIMAMVAGWWFSLFGAIMGECIPLAKLWIPTEPGHCISQSKNCGGGGIAHIILDFFTLLLPLYPVWKLHAKTSRKIYLSFVFLLGIIATLCSILRVSCLISLVKIEESDATASMWLSFFLEILEVICGIICISIPAFSPVLVRLRNSRIGSYAKGMLSASRFSSKRGSRGSTDQSSEKSFTKESPKFDSLPKFVTSPELLSLEFDSTRTQITTATERLSESENDGTTLDGHSESNVHVTQDWDVNSLKHASAGEHIV